jgi:hypothetical protein
LNNKEYLECLFDSDKPIIIYRVKGGFDVYTDFSKKINLTKDNAKNFFNKTVKKTNSHKIINPETYKYHNTYLFQSSWHHQKQKENNLHTVHTMTLGKRYLSCHCDCDGGS